jgi:hypothetical protein
MYWFREVIRPNRVNPQNSMHRPAATAQKPKKVNFSPGEDLKAILSNTKFEKA